jgi:hypothetical protein
MILVIYITTDSIEFKPSTTGNVKNLLLVLFREIGSEFFLKSLVIYQFFFVKYDVRNRRIICCHKSFAFDKCALDLRD